MTLAPVGTIRAMALVTEDREVLRPFTVDEYVRMLEVGILDDGEKVELLDGAIVEMSAESTPHLFAVSMLLRHVIRGLTDEGALVTANGPLKLLPDSMPQPDVAIVARRGIEVDGEYPVGAGLCAEVSLTSLQRDLNRKAGIYARAGVREYWVVDLKKHLVHVHLDPRDGAYTSITQVAPPSQLSPVYVSLPPLALETLFLDQ